MKKAFLTLGLAVAALTLTNCNKQENDVPGLDGIQARISLITEETKTVNDGMNTKWKSGDALSVWVADAAAPAVDYGANLKFDVDAESGTATGVVEELPASSNWYAVYPYDSHLVNPTANDGEKRSGYITVGSRANAAQTQNGNDSKAHLAGSSMPLYGVASNVTGTPSIVMKQVCGVIAVNVTNATNEPITVQSVKFTADNYIVGTYYMDFSSGEAELAPSGDNFVADWVELSVNGASPIAAGESAKFYIAVKPFSGNIVSISILSDKGESYKEAGNNLVPIEVSAGQIKTVNYTFESAVEVPAKEYPYEESFAASQGDFTIDNVAKPDGLNFVWAWNSSKYMKASGFYSNTNYETESWLISPVVDLATAKEPAVYFSQCINKYFFDVAAEATLWIREEGGNWNQIQIGHPELPESGNWSKMTDYVYPVGEFAGKKVQVGFKYVSTSNGAGTWEVKNFKLAEYEETPTVTLASIEVSNAKTSYNVGDQFVKPTVTAYYSDQSSKDVTASATFSGYELTKAGSYTVEVSYTEGGVTKTTSYGITVSAGDDPNVNTVSMTMAKYVDDNKCTVSTGNDVVLYPVLDLSSAVRMSTTGTANCGAFYAAGDDKQWRLYQNKGGDVTIQVADGCSLVSVSFTYAATNGGQLEDAEGSAIGSGSVCSCDGTSFSLVVGNSGDATNGQVRITAVEVKYTGSGTLPPVDQSGPTETTTSISMPNNATVYVGETFSLNATANVQATITYESEDTNIASVDANGVVTGVAEGTVKVYARIAAVAGSYTAAERYCNVTVSEKPQDVGGTWEATALSNIADGAQFVLVGTNASGSYAMSNDNGTSAAPKAVSVTISNGKISNPASNLVFTMKVMETGYIFTTDNGEKWVYTTATNNGIRIGTNENNLFNLGDSDYLTVSDGENTRYLGIYNSQDWRGYTSINNNIKDQTFTFYVKK